MPPAQPAPDLYNQMRQNAKCKEFAEEPPKICSPKSACKSQAKKGMWALSHDERNAHSVRSLWSSRNSAWRAAIRPLDVQTHQFGRRPHPVFWQASRARVLRCQRNIEQLA
mmetsp:Transcript_71273/g.195303  ORF Transcript_71273/g.195303 Transcript_71273/m.195303 type:complete len:111 (-) Transcript_71273:1870-2202(-)